jgi:hypothetical protein
MGILQGTFLPIGVYALHMIRDTVVPLADDSKFVRLGEQTRSIQNGSSSYSVTLNADFLSLLAMAEQGIQTKHAVALRPVEVQRPAYIIQPVEVLPDE